MAGQYDGKPVSAPSRTHARATRATMTPAQACEARPPSREAGGCSIAGAGGPGPERRCRDRSPGRAATVGLRARAGVECARGAGGTGHRRVRAPPSYTPETPASRQHGPTVPQTDTPSGTLASYTEVVFYDPLTPALGRSNPGPLLSCSLFSPPRVCWPLGHVPDIGSLAPSQ
jgi:hypothetical protein